MFQKKAAVDAPTCTQVKQQHQCMTVEVAFKHLFLSAASQINFTLTSYICLMSITLFDVSFVRCTGQCCKSQHTTDLNHRIHSKHKLSTGLQKDPAVCWHVFTPCLLPNSPVSIYIATYISAAIARLPYSAIHANFLFNWLTTLRNTDRG